VCWFVALLVVPAVLAFLWTRRGSDPAGTLPQVWFLGATAFLAGSTLTWLLFVRGRPRYPAHPLYRAAPPRPRHRVVRRARAGHAAAPLEPPPPAEPALASLDTHSSEPTVPHPGSSAAGALDRLGVAGGVHLPAVEIPAQGGPVDDPPPGEGR
jgi:hypothetical protein